MIARPKISRNERNTAERGAFEVGSFAPFSRPGPPGSRGPRASRACASTSTRPSTGTAPTSPRRSSPRRGPSSSSTSTSTDRRASAPRRVRSRRREWRRGLDRTHSLEPRRRNRSCESIVYAAGARTPGRERARRDANARARRHHAAPRLRRRVDEVGGREEGPPPRRRRDGRPPRQDAHGPREDPLRGDARALGVAARGPVVQAQVQPQAELLPLGRARVHRSLLRRASFRVSGSRGGGHRGDGVRGSVRSFSPVPARFGTEKTSVHRLWTATNSTVYRAASQPTPATQLN